jgi:hypothetical protein
MKQPRIIQRLLSLSLVGLLLLTATVGRGWQTLPAPAKKAVATSETAPKAEKPAKSETPETTIDAADFQAVVTPAASFDFGQSVFLWPAPAVLFLLLLSVPLLRRVQIPYYFFAYFQHVFGHHIAPNAP